MVDLPYNAAHPVVYDNDAHADVYTDELLLALSSAGTIRLKGFITSSPENECVNRDTYEVDLAGRDAILGMAERSGLRNVPRHFRGPSRPLERPASGRIEDTRPIDTPGSRRLVEEALSTSPASPLVVAMGGPLTVAADAYLLEPSIADRMILAWLGGTREGMRDYNGGVDPWASYIALVKLRLVQFPANHAMPLVPKSQFRRLPPTELTRWLIDKQHPHVNPNGEIWGDGDGQPVIPLIRPDYVFATKRVSFDRFDDRGIPVYRDDPDGRAIVVTHASQEIATEAWWEAMSDPAAWHGVSSDTRRAFYAAPFPVGRIGRIDAEDFDRGGQGVAYRVHNETLYHRYRDSHVSIVPADDEPGGYNVGAGGGFCVTGLSAGDWIGYTITVERTAEYAVQMRVASAGAGGSVHLEVDGVPTRTVQIPDTGGGTTWQTVDCGMIRIAAGVRDMRLVVDAEGGNRKTGNINYLAIAPIV